MFNLKIRPFLKTLEKNYTQSLYKTFGGFIKLELDDKNWYAGKVR